MRHVADVGAEHDVEGVAATGTRPTNTVDRDIAEHSAP